MHVVFLQVEQFRNLARSELRPAPSGLTVIVGENGVGKTSLLEAIGYASTLKSFRGAPREALVKQGEARAVIRTETSAGGHVALVELEVAVGGRGDVVQVNRNRVTRATDLLDALRVTVFSPDDLVLVKGGPVHRRDFLDDIVAAVHPSGASTRAAAERAHRQRSTLLRQAAGRTTPEVLTTLDVWDAQLSKAGEELVTRREQLVRDLTPVAAEHLAELSDAAGALELAYRRSYEGGLLDALRRARTEDIRRGVATVGPHRDEVEIRVGGLDARSRLSQGRQRAVTLALRLASHEIVRRATGVTPVLLLDDAFSELDDRSAKALVERMPSGQSVLTSAHHVPPRAEPAAVLELVPDGSLS